MPVGGTNSAPTPMEFVAGAVNACIAVVIETVASELGISVHAIETGSKAHMDVRGF
ncbi:OsmC family protein [Paramicrobacterium humi]|uniref:OsmC family protein n=1 Tax=Paramicrobacterium humi TaxID=640635 RepID=UPI0024820F7F|nr:OsmC family protein [Microbacterium humi]